MSLEAALAENTAAMKELVAALKITGENQERLIAGQAAAIAKVEEGKAPATRTRKPRGSEAEPAATAPEVAVAAPASEAADAAVAVPSFDDLKLIGQDFLKKNLPGSDKNPSVEELGRRKDFLTAVNNHFGVSKFWTPESELSDAQRIQAAFFVKRKHAGKDVDFSADYAWDQDPTQGGDDDDFDLG